MLTINYTTTPPGMWRYRVPETGQMVPDPKVLGGNGYFAYNDLESAVLAHYKSNGLIAPVDLRQRIVDYICNLCPPGYCRDSENRFIQIGVDILQSFSQIKQGTETIVDWFFREGGAKVDQATADSRAAICVTCPMNGPPQGCPSCGGNVGALRQLVDRLVGQSKTSMDNRLQACYVCGCELKAKIWFPLPLLKRHMTTDQLNAFPGPGKFSGFGGCWLKEKQ